MALVRTAVSPIEELKRSGQCAYPCEGCTVRTAVSPIEELKLEIINYGNWLYGGVRTAVSPIEELKPHAPCGYRSECRSQNSG